jgi:dihydroorotase
MRTILRNFHIIDEESDFIGSLILEHGLITDILPNCIEDRDAAMIIDGRNLLTANPDQGPALLMPAFVDLHAHFRDPGFPEKELLESASLAAAAGGFGTVICMANTKPVTDTIKKVIAIKERCDNLGLIDLFPVMSLTKGMEGKELSEITDLPNRNLQPNVEAPPCPLMLSEDGKDIADDALFLAAMKEAKRFSIPISCHCDFGGTEADALKKAGEKRKIWSRIEENNAVRRVIELGKKAECHIHIAHVSTKEAVEIIRRTKAELREKATADNSGCFTLTCEAMPHNFCLTEEDAAKLGDESFGRVNPPLRTEEDRLAIINALNDGTIDAIATDHAPHTMEDKANGAPGFSGLETAFAASYTELVRGTSPESGAPSLGAMGIKHLSSLMSANPARLLGLGSSGLKGRGRILKGYRADLVIIDPNAGCIVNPAKLKTRGKNSPFAGRNLYGEVLMTIHLGRVVFENEKGRN